MGQARPGLEVPAPDKEAAGGFGRIPREALSRPSSFIVAHNGDSFFYNPGAGIIRAPFVPDVFKSFGLSSDSRYFLYLKSNNKLPGFALHIRDLTDGTDRKITGGPVHMAAWSPSELRIAYVTMTSTSQFEVHLRDLRTGQDIEAGKGMIDPEYLEWSPDGERLLYVSVVPLTSNFIHDHKFDYLLHQHNIRRNTETTIPGVMQARFDGDRLLLLSKDQLDISGRLPNPANLDIRNFAVNAGRVFVSVVEKGRAVVKKWNEDTGEYETVDEGSIYTATEAALVVRDFTNSGVGYSYVSGAGGEVLRQAPFANNWLMPFGGAAYLVQGGAIYSGGACDGRACQVAAHSSTLSAALDFQQVSQQGQGNTHVLAVETGTVAGTTNTVTCNTFPVCQVPWDGYASPCNDPNGGLGNYVSIAHPDGTYSFYGHLKSGSVQVIANQAINQGDYIADQGHSGSASSTNGYNVCGDHLHYQRQTGPAPYSQSIPTNFSELPCTLNCTTAYVSQNIENTIPSVASLTVALSPATVIGTGATVANRVILPSPAPAGGVSLTLSSSNPAAATVLPALTIPQGQSSATFTINILPVSVSTPVTISATDGSAQAQATLTVKPVSLTRVLLVPNSMAGGASSTQNEIDLDAPAPSNMIVTLTSSNPAVAAVPANVTIPAGSAYALFPISTSSVTSTTVAGITATYGASSRSYNLSVTPVALSSVTAPSSVVANSSSTGQVNLNGGAPAGGATVSISSANPAVLTVPASVTVPAGSFSSSFPITTLFVAAPTSVTITAAYLGVNRTDTVSVIPPVSISSISPPAGVAGNAITVTMNGSNFISGATVNVNNPAITVSNIVIVSATQMRATFTIASNAAAAVASVSVTTANGTSNNISFVISSAIFTPIRINGGGTAYTDALGRLWSADSGWSGGGAVNEGGPVVGTTDPSLYQTAHWGPRIGAGTLKYTFTVPNGNYTVNLKFSEPVLGIAGSRIFNVSLNSQIVAPNFDIYAVSGATNQALDLPFAVNVTNYKIAIELLPVINNSRIAAIEILAGAQPAPTVSGITPGNGAVGTNVPVTIAGTNLDGNLVVNAGPNIKATNVTVVSATQATATLQIAAGAAPGTANVTVTTAGGSASPVPFSIGPVGPTLTAVTPASGVTGTSVAATLTGTNFAAGATVNVSNPGVTVSNVTVVNSTQITATLAIAAGAATGAANVTVTTAGGTSGAVVFTINPALPTLTAVTSASGVTGTSVAASLTGTNFAAGATVNVSNPGVTVSNVTVVSSTQITATLAIAAGAATGAATVTVTVSGNTSNTRPFTVLPPAPVLSGIAPGSGVTATSVAVTLTGANFVTGATVNVSNPGVTVSNVTVVDSTQITATFTIAAGAAPGTANVTVTTTGGATSPVPFSIVPVVPGLTAVSPASGAPGTSVGVTLTGTSFVAGATVSVSNPDVTVSNVTVVSGTQITAALAISAAAATGPANVTVTTTGGTSGAAVFTINASLPTLTAVSPASGITGTSVAATLTGTNFAAGATVGVSNPGVTVNNVAVVNSTQITATLTIAAGAATGAANVTVTVSGSTSNAMPFTVLPPVPVLSGIAPGSGVTSTSVAVTLTGANFVAGATVSVSNPGVTVSNVTVVSGTQITAALAISAVAATGPANVTVTTTGGTSGPAVFTINPALPTLTAVTPASGIIGTNVSVTLTGTNFLAGAAVNVGNPDVTVSNVTVVSGTQITAALAISAAAASGPANVTVTTTGGTSGAAVFTINPALPTLTAVSPASGILGTNVPVTLTGTNFAAGTTVNVSNPGVTVSNVAVVNSMQITATFAIAAGAAIGVANVTVTVSGSTSNAMPFTVIPPAPVLSGISPGSGVTSTSVAVTLTGANFVAGATVNPNYTGVTVSNVTVGSGTQMTATLVIAAGAVAGTANVTVTTSGGTSAAAPFTITVPVFAPIRINGGGPAYTDALGRVWSADSGGTGGGAVNEGGPVVGTTDPALYQTAHWGAQAQGTPLSYTFAVPNGSYTVNLKFSEPTFTQTGKRVFHVKFNGQTVLSNFDIYAVSGAANQALDVALPVTVTGGQIQIQFVGVVYNTRIAAIEILAGAQPAPTVSGITPNSGAAGTNVPVTIAGTNLNGNLVVNAGPNIKATNVTVVSATQATATLQIAAGAAAGTANVTVTTAGGGTSPVPFSIVPAVPTLATVSPASGAPGTSVPVTLTGTNFVAGTTVGVSNPGVTVSNVTVVSGTQITATLAIAGAAAGPANVTVTTAGGTSGAQQFTVQ